MDDFLQSGSWEERLAHVAETMRQVSFEDDPRRMVEVYRTRLADVSQMDGFLSISRRDVELPNYLIARSSTWDTEPDPWVEREKLPRLRGGIIAELLSAGEPRVISDFEVSPADPAAEYFTGMRSLVAIPIFDHGEVLNLIIQMRKAKDGFNSERFPEMVWLTNLFARATNSLFLSKKLQEANDRLERQAAEVARIQESLLPPELPKIQGLEVAVHYEAAEEAGGDYYDFFPLSEDRWGIMIADVSGHGTPAAVLMAITHTLAHLYDCSRLCPVEFLEFLNKHLTERYTQDSGAFITALYGIYDPRQQTFTFALAGHPPPRLKKGKDGSLITLPTAKRPPLGILSGVKYDERVLDLAPGDQLVFFTDGLTEARNSLGEFFGEDGVDAIFSSSCAGSRTVLDELLGQLKSFVGGRCLDDDLTVIVARVCD